MHPLHIKQFNQQVHPLDLSNPQTNANVFGYELHSKAASKE
jgi:hypothetical protein